MNSDIDELASTFLYSVFTGSPSPVDPPDNYFRVRLVCCLLDTCGLYFDHGSAKKKLDVFLIFFQVRLWISLGKLVFACSCSLQQ